MIERYCCQVDVKAVNEAKGNPFYRDHLPLIGEDIEVSFFWFTIATAI